MCRLWLKLGLFLVTRIRLINNFVFFCCCCSLTTPEQANSFRDEMYISSLEPFTQTSIDFLNQMCDSVDPFIHLTFDSFVALNQSQPPDRLAQNFQAATRITKAELMAQIKFDLCRYFLHEKKTHLARESVIECRRNWEVMRAEYAAKLGRPTNEYLFCTFAEDELRGCLMACGVVSDDTTRLLMCMNDSVGNDYKVREVGVLEEVKRIAQEIFGEVGSRGLGPFSMEENF